MAAYVMGMNAKLYYGAAAAALGAMTELSNVKDLTVTLDAGEADITTRANSGWRATAATLREATVTWDMVWASTGVGATGFAAIKTAYLAGTTLELAVLDGSSIVAGNQGLKGAFSFTSFSESQPLEEGITVSVTAKLTTFSEWVSV